jgi:hypothetical protein
LVLSFATLGRVLIWQDAETIAAQGVRQHPESLRARLDLGVQGIWVKNYPAATKATLPLLDSHDPRHRAMGRLQLVVIGCLNGQGADPRNLQLAAADGSTKVTIFEVQLARALVNVARKDSCGAVTPGMIGATLEQLADAATAQDENAATKFTVRTIAARLYVRDGRWQQAEPQAELAWAPSGNLPLAGLLVRIYFENGKHREASDLLTELERRARPFDIAAHAEIARLHKLLKGGMGPEAK